LPVEEVGGNSEEANGLFAYLIIDRMTRAIMLRCGDKWMTVYEHIARSQERVSNFQ
jgi:hypothetical protein